MLQKLSKRIIDTLHLENKMKFLIIGCGSIGERHIRNLNNLSAGKILAYDINPDRLHLMKENYNVETYETIEKGLNQNPDLVLVCTPPSLHITFAMKAIDSGAHVFVEKPISHVIEGVNELLAEAKKKNLKVFVGYNHRFYEGVKLLKKIFDDGAIGKPLSIKAEFSQYLPDWRPWQDYRESYTAKKELGGGIILDGSHEIDYVRWILGEIKEVSCSADKISDLEVDVEDTADISVKFENNAIGEIHLDFIQKGYTRNCKITGERGTITLDYPKKIVELYSSDNKKCKKFPIKSEVSNTYVQEIKHVIECIKTNKEPLINGDSAKKVLEIALAAKESAKTGKVIKL